MPYSDVFERLVKGNGDIAGIVAYGIYKKAKREFIRKKQGEQGFTTIPDDVLEEFYATQTDYVLELYREHSEDLTREFLDKLYGEDVAKEKQQLEHKYIEQYGELAKAAKPSFWYGVLQSVVGSFLFLLAGYVLLKMNGVWDILLNNLLR